MSYDYLKEKEKGITVKNKIVRMGIRNRGKEIVSELVCFYIMKLASNNAILFVDVSSSCCFFAQKN